MWFDSAVLPRCVDLHDLIFVLLLAKNSGILKDLAWTQIKLLLVGLIPLLHLNRYEKVKIKITFISTKE